MNNMPPVPSNYNNDELLTYIHHYCKGLPQPIIVALDRFAELIDENNELKRENQTLDRLIDRLEQQLKEALNGNND